MLPAAQDVYSESVRNLPPAERLRLAALILDELTRPGGALVDSALSWSVNDQSDLNAYTLRYADEVYPEDDELARSQ